MSADSNANVRLLLMAGGAGTRLWPLSRTNLPKQFINLPQIDNSTLFKRTLERCQPLTQSKEAYVLTDDNYRFLASRQIEDVTANAKLHLTPGRRNTAPHFIYALEDLDEDEIVVMTPTDHYIEDSESWLRSINAAVAHAQKNADMVLLGLQPTFASTAYGYIRADSQGKVTEFCEKPEAEVAGRYIEQGNYYWNTGIVVGQVKVIKQSCERYAQTLVAQVRAAIAQRTKKYGHDFIEADAWSAVASAPFDTAVLEKASNLHMIQLQSQWSDLGSFDALWSQSRAVAHTGHTDQDGNVAHGQVELFDVSSSYIHATTERKIVVAGVADLVVVDTDDALLVATRQQIEQRLKAIVNELEQKSAEIVNHGSFAHRPWGWYKHLGGDSGWLGKQICIFSGQSISLQRHSHRSEHWIVVSGEAQVTRGKSLDDLEKAVLQSNQSIFIPVGEIHSIENTSEEPVIIIEVQTGSLFSEDDIERYKDQYGRT